MSTHPVNFDLSDAAIESYIVCRYCADGCYSSEDEISCHYSDFEMAMKALGPDTHGAWEPEYDDDEVRELIAEAVGCDIDAVKLTRSRRAEVGGKKYRHSGIFSLAHHASDVVGCGGRAILGLALEPVE